MIELRQVTKQFGPQVAVSNLSVSIPVGQCVGLLGPNGAGKTTTLRIITGYIPPTTGVAEVAGQSTLTASIQTRRMIGYLPETPPLHGEMRVVDFLMYRAGLFGVPRRQARGAVGRAMETCRVSDVARKRTGHLSKGYKQRVGLAAALVHDPGVLILDEPTSGLDPTQIRETRSLIRTLAEKRTVLVSSHILPEIEQTCDRVLVMARGRLLADGTPEAIRESAGGQTYTLEARGGEGDLGERVRRLAGVHGAAVEMLEDGWVRVLITPTAGAGDLRDAIAGAAAGWRVREISCSRASLERAFVKIIEDEAAGGVGAGPAGGPA